jgi:hypothetical protein
VHQVHLEQVEHLDRKDPKEVLDQMEHLAHLDLKEHKVRLEQMDFRV